jgi:cytochrome c biogenesis protein CcdA
MLTVIEHNIMEASSTLLNQALCARFSVPAAQHSVTPALFAQGGYAVRGGITPESVGSLLQRTLILAQDDSWQVPGSGESEAARAEVERRYASLTLSVVVLAGLLDGINPCAFATIILFLSWLQVARRTPREMLLTGAAFILAVFIAYLSAGLVLYQVLAGLSRFTWIQRWMNFVFAAFALLAAFLSFRDGWRAGRGRMDEMTLQLPGFLKNRIRSAIRTGAKARRFIVSAFVTGLIVSLLELACTGQVYAPIVYQIQQGRAGAIAWLVLYNLAFILPLTLIFLLTWAGLRSEHLLAFQKKHTRAVKFALGLLFCALAVLILFGDQLLH